MAITECMSSEHFGQLAWQFKRMSGSSAPIDARRTSHRAGRPRGYTLPIDTTSIHIRSKQCRARPPPVRPPPLSLGGGVAQPIKLDCAIILLLHPCLMQLGVDLIVAASPPGGGRGMDGQI